MADKWKKAIKCILFIVLAGACIAGAFRIFKWKDTSGDYNSSIEQLKNTPKNTIDVVFTGSSHTYCGIYPGVFWEQEGYSVFDMAISGQSKYSGYYSLKELLKTQSPKVVFVDLYPFTYEKHAVEGNEHRNMMALPISRNSFELLTDYYDAEVPEERKKTADYFLRWPIVHTRYRELGKYDFLKNPPNSYLRGEGLMFISNPIEDYDVSETEYNPAELSDKNMKLIDDFIALSEKENFSLVFTVIPYHASAADLAILDSAVSYIEGKGVPVLDLNRERNVLNLDSGKDFIDYDHLNGYGAVKLSSYYTQYLNDNYDLTDHRGDSAYWLWDADRDYCNKLCFEQILNSSGSLSDALSLLSSRSDYTTIVCLELDYRNADYNYYNELSILGMNDEDYAAGGGVWVYENGALSRLSYNTENVPASLYKLGTYDTLSVEFHGDFQPGNVMISTEDISNCGFYLKVTAYDNRLERIAFQKGY